LSVNYECKTASTEEEALAKLEAESVEVVLTESSMPGLSGQDLLVIVRKHYPETPVIMISGMSDEDHARRLTQLGAFDYLLKPFRLEVVETSVKRALDYKRSLPGD